MTNPIFAALAGAAVGAACTFAGAFFLAGKQFQRMKELSMITADLSAWHTAAKDLRIAFAAELGLFESKAFAPDDVDRHLLAAYTSKHAAAIAAFESFVQPDRLTAYREKWRQYHSGHKDYPAESGIVPGGGAPQAGSPFSELSVHFVGRTEEPHVLAAKRIRALLAFTDETPNPSFKRTGLRPAA